MREKMEILLKNTGGFIAGLLGAALIFALYHTPGQQKIGTVNITQMIDGFVQHESVQSLPPQTVKADVQQFGHKLEQEMQHFAQQHHLLLLPREAVIAGAQDYTAAIQKSMREQSA